MLKNSIFYVAQKIGTVVEGTNDTSSELKLVIKVFRHLLERSDEGIYRPYFLPYSDVFDFKKDDGSMSSKNRKIFDMRRELAIKYILDILGVDLRPSDKRFFLDWKFDSSKAFR